MNKYPEFLLGVSYGDKYDHAMEITTKEDAEQYFERLVEHSIANGYGRTDAIKIEKENVAYWAGYFSDETRARVEELFACSHPFFGSIKDKPISAKVALDSGQKRALTLLKQRFK